MPDITYRQLAKAVHDIAVASARNAETITKNAEWISEEARDTGRIADQIGALRVDKATVGETQQLSKVMQGLANSVSTYAVASDTTARAAQAAHDANKTSHDGVNEAAHRSPVGREIYDIDSNWFAQE